MWFSGHCLYVFRTRRGTKGFCRRLYSDINQMETVEVGENHDFCVLYESGSLLYVCEENDFFLQYERFHRPGYSFFFFALCLSTSCRVTMSVTANTTRHSKRKAHLPGV